MWCGMGKKGDKFRSVEMATFFFLVFYFSKSDSNYTFSHLVTPQGKFSIHRYRIGITWAKRKSGEIRGEGGGREDGDGGGGEEDKNHEDRKKGQEARKTFQIRKQKRTKGARRGLII